MDWAKDKHDVLVQEADGTRVLASAFAHDERGLGELCRTLVQLGVGLVAIERPDGLLIEWELDTGSRLMAIHPNQVAATRAPFRPGARLGPTLGRLRIGCSTGRRLAL